MPCDRRLKSRQTVSQRKAEVRKVVEKINTGLMRRTIKPIIGRQGGIAFQGLPESERDGVSDACVYRLLGVYGSPLALAEIARAEQMAGRSVNKQAVAAGLHSHDGGTTWGTH